VIPPPGTDDRRERLVEICRRFPEVDLRRGQHIKFSVRGTTFAYYVFNEHNDGRIGLLCKAPPGQQSRVVQSDSDRYYMPAYIGPRGWIGLRIDLPEIDWGEVERLLIDSYQLVAPKRLAEAIWPA
jgi:hypothetical protein